MRCLARVSVALLLALAGGGCRTAGPAPGPAPPAAADTSPRPEEARWPFWPVRMRLHPLSRLVLDAEGRPAVIEARLELLDAEDDTTKAWGYAVIDLVAIGNGSGDRPVATWEIDLADRAVNAERYDDVTRTYLVPLQLEPGTTLPERPGLVARFESANGATLSDQLELRWR